MKKRRSFRKPHRVKKKKSILRSRLFWYSTLILTITGIIFYYLFFSKTFQIKEVVVVGEEVISENKIKEIVPKENIFLIDISKIRTNILENFLPIANVDIKREFPDKLNIIITERVAVGIWCEQENCFLIDKDGVAFERALPEINLIKIFSQKELLKKEKIEQILKIQQELNRKEIQLKWAKIVSEERLNVKTTENWEIYFNLMRDDFSKQIFNLGIIMREKISPERRKNLEYIDLRFDKIFIYPHQ